MRFTSKGIGWLIAGAIIGATAVESSSWASAAGTLMIGLVFAAVYVIKQFFAPKGIGWFIAGGIFLAFSVETLLGVTGRLLKNSFFDRGDLSSTLIGLIISCACLFAFYKSNKHAVDGMASDMGIDLPQTGFTEPVSAPAEAAYEPAAAQTAAETAADQAATIAADQAASATASGAAAHEGSAVEFEIKTVKEDKADGPGEKGNGNEKEVSDQQ